MIILFNRLSLFNYSEVKKEVQNKEKKLKKSFAEFNKQNLGIYYTPQFIVEYIVDVALSLSLASKITRIKEKQELVFQNLRTKREVTEASHATLLLKQILPNFSVCDVSMGWGVFLLYAFDYLIHLYKSSLKLLEDDISGLFSKKISSEEDIKHHLVSSIISNNLFGVDIAKDSVELASFKTIEKAMGIIKTEEIRLPRPNYFVGNCLVGNISRDFKIDMKNIDNLYTESIIYSMNKNDRIRVKEWLGKTDTLHWNLCFPKIIESGGFDVIVGNPPYINVKKIDLGERRTYSKLFETYNPNGDISNVFWERGLKLCKNDGIISFITPRYWLEGSHSNSLRNFILRNS
ncbi:MAG: Eco57I restriction-modification methylase domain-containing protein, partial [Candidatus Thorarchaeota archaeon]